MRVQITANNLGRAIARAFRRRGRVRRPEPDLYVITCSEGHEHFVTVEEGAGGEPAAAECKTADGGPCPSILSRKACYHIPLALALHLGCKSMRDRALGRGDVASVTAHVRASQVTIPESYREPWEDSIMVSFEGGRKVERVRGLMI